jgi:hypothetical protein
MQDVEVKLKVIEAILENGNNVDKANPIPKAEQLVKYILAEKDKPAKAPRKAKQSK